MTDDLLGAVSRILAEYDDPYLERPISDYLQSVDLSDRQLTVRLVFPYPVFGLVNGLARNIEPALAKVAGASRARIRVTHDIPAPNLPDKTPIPGVKHVVAVASGKGGVGKSTTCANLALALAAEGARVGVMDADIYGPSQPMMLGVPEGTRPSSKDGQFFEPVIAQGLQLNSMGLLADERTPMAWRGPMVAGAVQQSLMQTAWDELDFLLVDMPPGTGDAQLTLSQKAPLSGARIIMRILNATRLWIGIEDNKPEATAAMEQALAAQPDLDATIWVCPTKYPSGGEKQLIQLITGEEIPAGQRPAALGFHMHNPATLVAVADAVLNGCA